jgi:2-succinyl-6-hydroxy-2,4-cyclohexadiene-1-carboxylate synthase
MGSVSIFREMVALPELSILVRDTRTEGKAILCLHGRWGRGETWVDFMLRYGDRYRVIAPDLRGHGLSGKPATGYSGAEMAEDMLGLLDHLGLESAIVVGHSMGGHVAACLAASHAERVDAVAILDKSAAGPARAQEGGLRPGVAGDPVTGHWPLPFATLQAAREYVRKEMESDLSYEYFMNSLSETAEGYGMLFSREAVAENIARYEDWFDLLPNLDCPVLLMRSTGSGAVPDGDFARMRSLLPDCMACEIAHPDHNVHLADKAAFHACFDSFLAGLGRGRTGEKGTT